MTRSARRAPLAITTVDIATVLIDVTTQLATLLGTEAAKTTLLRPARFAALHRFASLRRDQRQWPALTMWKASSGRRLLLVGMRCRPQGKGQHRHQHDQPITLHRPLLS